MATAQEILSSPDYINANLATKQAIFDKHIASTPDYVGANAATQEAIQKRFGLAGVAEVPQGRKDLGLVGNAAIAVGEAKKAASKFATDLAKGTASLADTTIGGVIPSVAGLGSYVATRFLGQSPQEAAHIQEVITSATDKPFGKAFGITQDPAYTGEASQRIMGAVGGAIGRGANALSDVTGGVVAPSDIVAAGMIGAPVAGRAVAPVASATRRAATAVAESRPVNALTTAIQDAQAANASAAAERAAMRQAAPAQPVSPASTQFGRGTAGAAEVTAARTAQETASGLPVPIQLMEHQATGSRPTHQFARETAKTEIGLPIAERNELQNAQILQNLDAMIEGTGSEIASPFGQRRTGESVVEAIDQRMKARKAEVSAKYEAARQAGEGAMPVQYQPVIDYINEQGATVREKLAPILEAVHSRLKAEDPQGLGVVPINQMEDIYKFVNANMGKDPTNILHGAKIKGLINESLNQSGGNLYQAARADYANFANEFKNKAIMQKLTGTKPGTADRRVALEDIQNEIVNRGSLDDLRNVGESLKRGGTSGLRAWQDIQGQTIAELQNAITSNISIDSTGQRTVSPAKFDSIIRNLDYDGKLDYLFGKKGAQQLRDLRDTTMKVHVSPSGTVNFSNSASAVQNALDRFEKSYLGSITGKIPYVGPIVEGIAKSKIKKAHENELSRRVQEIVNYNALNQ